MATLTASQQQVFDLLRRYNCQVKREEYAGRRGQRFAHYDAVSSDPRGYFTVRATAAQALIDAGLLVWSATANAYGIQEAN